MPGYYWEKFKASSVLPLIQLNRNTRKRGRPSLEETIPKRKKPGTKVAAEVAIEGVGYYYPMESDYKVPQAVSVIILLATNVHV